MLKHLYHSHDVSNLTAQKVYDIFVELSGPGRSSGCNMSYGRFELYEVYVLIRICFYINSTYRGTADALQNPRLIINGLKIVFFF